MGKPKPAKQTINQTQTQTAGPWAPAEDAFKSMIDSAQTAYGATPKTPVYTGPNATQLQAQEMLKGIAPTTAAGAGAMSDIASKTANGFYLNPANNPGMGGMSWSGGTWEEDINPALQGMIQAAINPLRDQLDSNVLSIGDAAKMAGAYGGDRGELLKGTALSRFNRDSMDVGSLYYGQAYENMTGRKHSSFESGQDRSLSAAATDAQLRAAAFENERQRQMGAGALFNDANNLLMDPARILSALGDQEAGWTQAANAAAIDAPWAGMDRLATILGTTTPFAGSTTVTNGTTTGTAGGGGASGVLGGALGGASAGAAFGPWGAGIGAIAGGLGGLFG